VYTDHHISPFEGGWGDVKKGYKSGLGGCLFTKRDVKKNLLITKIIRTFTAKITHSISFKKKL